LRASGLAAAYGALPLWLSSCARERVVPAAQQLATAEVWTPTPQPSAPTALPTAAPARQAGGIVHLLNRITYGPRPGDVERIGAIGWDAFLEQQLHPERIDDSALDRQMAAYPSLAMSNTERIAAYPARGRKEGKPTPADAIRELELATLVRAISSERQLFEIMVDFWSNHFNIYTRKDQIRWLKADDDRDVIRAHALGSFRDLLLASARSPAMLVYLDNARNLSRRRAQRDRGVGINENYAREVMELHTVGADGGYTHDDIITVARALTGWTVERLVSDDAGSFLYLAHRHDDDVKTLPFLNLTLPAGGNMEEGETLLARLAEHPQTARRIAYKLAVTFVADDPPPALVDRAAQTYLASGTDIRQTLAVILRSDEFKASAGQKVKLPLRLLVSAARALGIEPAADDPKATLPLLSWLQVMGQPLFGWGAPDGYPQIGAAWVNTGAMLARWNLAFALAEGRIKKAQPDLKRVAPNGAQASELVDAVAEVLLHERLPAPARTALINYVADGGAEQAVIPAATRDTKLAGLAGLLLASPVFQVH
jgi:uncharacterized protein (DUF1800 family)